MRFPPNAPLMIAAAESARALMTSTEWGASGPKLLTRLIDEFGLRHLVLPWTAAYPVRTWETAKLFQPGHRQELEDRIAGADFVHLWNQIWRWIRIPKDLGPPEGSFLDGQFRRFGIRFTPEARMSAEAVTTWFREFKLVDEVCRRGDDVPSIMELIRQCEQYRAERDHLLGEQDQVREERDQAILERGQALLQRDRSERQRFDDARIAELSAALAYARWERKQLLRSASWRITAPVRAIGRRLRRFVPRQQTGGDLD
jgi:hypothetical protein